MGEKDECERSHLVGLATNWVTGLGLDIGRGSATLDQTRQTQCSTKIAD